MSKSFNVVIATAGRPSLQRMIDSIAPQLTERDYLTIIWDCEPIDVRIDSECKYISIHNPEPLGFWGHGSRNRWQDQLPGDYIMNADDDDIYHPDAMKRVREVCTEEKLYVFKLVHSGIVIPKENVIAVSNIGTPCGVYPIVKPSLPSWGHFYGGDGEFYVQLSKLLPVQFINKVIYFVKERTAYFGEEIIGEYNCEHGHAMNLISVSGEKEFYCPVCRKSYLA